MSRHARPKPKAPAARKLGNLEISTLAKWVLLIIFMILVIIILVKIGSTGDKGINDLCERSGGLTGC